MTAARRTTPAPSVRVVALVFALLSGGCTHALQVRNLDQYRKEVPPAEPRIIRLENGSLDPAVTPYFQFVQTALRRSDVELVGFSPATDPPPDLIVRVTPRANYSGSGWNYLITFPGFLVFAHAWNGFLYEADINTIVEVARPATADKPSLTKAIETRYDVRFCDFDRGAATSSGWYIPGYGGSNLIVGAFMVPYDTDATPKFQEQVEKAYGGYIAGNIVEMVHQELPAPGAQTGQLDPLGSQQARNPDTP